MCIEQFFVTIIQRMGGCCTNLSAWWENLWHEIELNNIIERKIAAHRMELEALSLRDEGRRAKLASESSTSDPNRDPNRAAASEYEAEQKRKANERWYEQQRIQAEQNIQRQQREWAAWKAQQQR